MLTFNSGIYENSGIRTSPIFTAEGVGKVVVFVHCMVLYHKGLVLIGATVVERLCRAVVHSLNPDETQVERLCCRAVVHSLNPDGTQVGTVQTEL